MARTEENLPFIDRHCITVDAPPDATWNALLSVPRGFTGRKTKLFARFLGCTDVGVSGLDPLRVGSSFPGFHVVNLDPPTNLLLEGRHRFSRYRLGFTIEELSPQRCRLCAETRAEFPHLHGALYRSLVIGTRLHILVVRNILRATTRRAQRGLTRVLPAG